jgi:hypothetical protein
VSATAGGFAGHPKQWLIAREAPAGFAVAAEIAGWRVMRAEGVPLISVIDAGGASAGLIIGWLIRDGAWIGDGETLRLGPGESLDAALERACGRFVWIRPEGDGAHFGLDAGGLLPAVWSPALGAVASTPAMLGKIGRIDPDPALEAVFDFPRRRGFFPFGLTPWRGVSRLLPNHELDLARMEAVRVRPAGPTQPLPDDERSLAAACAEILDLVRGTVEAIVRRDGGVLYLSGGHDSRMVLAACRAVRDDLICETIGARGALEVAVAKQVADCAGARHERLDLIPASDAEIAAWLERTGRCIYDPVTRLVATAVRYDRGGHPMTGSCAEILRGSNWDAADLADDSVDLPLLLERVRMPPEGGIAEAGARWLAGLPPLPRTALLDIAKIEIIYGCWAGPSVYGHPIPRPSMHPFNIRRIYDLSAALPPRAKLGGEVYRAYMAAAWPALLQPPVNRAAGLNRLRFLKDELKRLAPKKLKLLLKPYR